MVRFIRKKKSEKNMKILLDTNFVLIPGQFGVDIYTEIDRIILEKHELYILDKTIEELKKIMNDKKQKKKNREAAKLGYQILKTKNVKVLKTKKKGTADDELAAIKGYVIATQDMELKKRIKGQKIVLRAKKYLEIK